MRYFITLLFIALMLAGSISSCKHPSENKPIETTHIDTSHHPCDTCHVDTTHLDTTHHTNPGDTTSHAFHWTEMTIPTESNLTGVWVFGPNDIWCNGGDLYHYDGVSWTKKIFHDTRQVGGLSGFSMFSPDSTLWLTDASMIEHCFPATYKAVQYRPNVDGGYLHSAWGTSSHDMFFVGDAGTILHFDGTNWISYPKVTTKALGSIWGTSDNDVWVDGFNPQTAESVLLHYDGTTWVEIDLSRIGNIGVGRHGLGGIWETDSSGHKIVYATGSLVWHQKDNGPWINDSAKIGNEVGSQFIGLYYSRGTGPNDYMITGDGGFITHWNGSNWHRYDELYNPGNASYVTHGMDLRGNTACVVGVKNDQNWILVGRR